MKELKIVVPEGMEIDKANSTFECIKFKTTNIKTLPTEWGAIGLIEGYYIDGLSKMCSVINKNTTENSHSGNKNVYPTEELAEAGLALTQLLYLRDIYNNGWVANWFESYTKYCIHVMSTSITRHNANVTPSVMHFKTRELRDTFLHNFKDLLETAKPLL